MPITTHVRFPQSARKCVYEKGEGESEWEGKYLSDIAVGRSAFSSFLFSFFAGSRSYRRKGEPVFKLGGEKEGVYFPFSSTLLFPYTARKKKKRRGRERLRQG